MNLIFNKIFLFVLITVNLIYSQEDYQFFNIKNVVKHLQGLCNKTEFGFVDLHNSVLARIFEAGNPSAIEDTNYFVNTKWIKESGLSLIFLSIGIPRFSMQNEDTISISHVLSFLRSFQDYVSKNHQEFIFSKTDAEATTEIKNGKVCFVYALEGLNLIGNELFWIDSLYDVGVRMVGIGHTFIDQIVINPWEGTNNPSFTNDSSEISEFGNQAINKLIEKRIIVDLSHLGDKAFWEAVDIIDGRQPVVVSHTSSKNIFKHFRNLDDIQVKKISESDGLIGVIFSRDYLSKKGTADFSDYQNHFRYLKSISRGHTIFIGSDLEGKIFPFNNYQKLFQSK